MKIIFLSFLIHFFFSSMAFAVNVEFSTSVDANSSDLIISSKVSNWQRDSIKFSFPWQPGHSYKNITHFTATQNGKLLNHQFVAPSNFGETAHFLVSSVDKTDIEVSYRVKESKYWKTTNSVEHRYVKITSTYFQLLEEIDNYSSLSFKFSLPVGWSVHCPLEKINTTTCSFTSAKNFRRALEYGAIAIGKWQVYDAVIKGMNFQFLHSGRLGFSFGDLVNSMIPALKWGMKVMQRSGLKKFQIVTETYGHDQHQGTGQGHIWGFHAVLKDDMTLKEFKTNKRARDLLVHESFHAFSWLFTAEDNGENLWINEGLTQYLTLLGLKEAYFSDWLSYLKAGFANEIESKYYLNFANKDLTIDKAQSIGRWDAKFNHWTSRQLSAVLYNKTALLLLMIDFDAENRGLTARSTDVITSLWKKYGVVKTAITRQLVIDEFEQVLGTWAKQIIRFQLGSTTVLPIDYWFENLLNIKINLVNFHTLGFEVLDSAIGVKFNGEFLWGINNAQRKMMELENGDIILKVEGTDITSAVQFKQLITMIPLDTVNVYINRNGTKIHKVMQVFKTKKIDSFGK